MPFKYLLTADASLTINKLAAAAPPTASAPEVVIDWLARLRLLHNVPFAYLVPHEALLPLESIRFFYLDRNWTDAAVDGALAVGAITTKDRAQLQASYETIRNAVDDAGRDTPSDLFGVPCVEVELHGKREKRGVFNACGG